MRISSIAKTTPDDFRDAIEGLADAKAKGLIVDLRGCVGGLFTGAIEIADLFLSQGTIVLSKDRGRDTKTHRADPFELIADVPIAVLVDRQTASSAEIIAGALKHNDRAVVIGERTFGKGDIQSLMTLDNGALLKLTTGEFFMKGGQRLEKPANPKEGDRWGIDPTEGYEIELTDGEREKLKSRKGDLPDRALVKAIEYFDSATQ